MSLKNILFISIAILIFTACSSKHESVESQEVEQFHKNVSNNKINNSKAVHRATLRPYVVFGKKYYPFVPKIGDSFRGISSWYGPNFHAKKTSNGEIYNMYAYTAAHKTLPMNTMLRVDNLDNSKSVIVRINDRGPFVDGRIIDLSNKAAHSINMVKKGTANVKITVLGFNGLINNTKAPKSHISLKKPKVKYQKNIKKIVKKNIVEDNYSIQVGAFANQSGALKTKYEYESKFTNKFVTIKKILNNSQYLFKVFIKGFSNRTDAENFKFKYNLDNALVLGN